VNCIHLARACVNTAIILRVPQTEGYFGGSWATASFSRRALLHVTAGKCWDVTLTKPKVFPYLVHLTRHYNVIRYVWYQNRKRTEETNKCGDGGGDDEDDGDAVIATLVMMKAESLRYFKFSKTFLLNAANFNYIRLKVAAEWLSLLLRIREVPGLNLGPKIVYSDRILVVFLSTSR
jgi:hypothetical protein